MIFFPILMLPLTTAEYMDEGFSQLCICFSNQFFQLLILTKYALLPSL